MSLIALSLSGCALEGNVAVENAPVNIGPLAGQVVGGETPISGANVILWETDNNSNATYGSTGGKQLATTTTGSGGYFSFNGGPSYTCDSGQFAYITSSGGDVTNGGGTYNNSQVQIVAVGPCSSLTSSTFVIANEISTVAAAYALGNFMSVGQGSAGKQLVYIGAPANNNATTGSCTGTGPSMTCTAAGLAHAFLNATYLSNSIGTNAAPPNGYARQTLPSSFAQYANTEVPGAIINSLADVLENCTNSASGNGNVSPTLFVIGTGGSGYVSPTVSFSGGAGSGAAGTANMTGVSSIAITNGGANYTAAPTVTFDTSVGTTATGTAVLSGGVVTSITITNPGLGYTATPNIVITPAASDTTGSGATATAALGTATGTITSVTVTSEGSGYTLASPPTLTFADASGPGTGASATPTVLAVSTNCSSLFAAATPPTAPAPVDTLSAILNIAKYPLNNAATIFGLIPTGGAAAFQSTVTAAPHDWSIAIYYGTTGGTTLAGYLYVPQYVVLDANDDVFVEIANQTSGSGYAGGIAALGSYGSAAWINAPSSTVCVNNGELAADMNGYVWMTVPATSSNSCTATTFNGVTNTSTTAQAIFGFKASTGVMSYGFLATGTPSVQSAPEAIAFDRYNNMWFARESSSCTQCLFQLPYTTGTPGTYGNALFPQNALYYLDQVILDANANVYASDIRTSTAGNLYILPNTATSGAPTYPATPGTIKATLPCSYNMGVVLDKANNVYSGSYCTSFEVAEYTPTLNSGGGSDSFGSAVNTYTAAALTSASAPTAAQGEVDGNGVLWYTNYDTIGGLYFQATPGSTYLSSGQALTPAFFSTGGGGSTPSSNDAAAANSRDIAIDSTGSIWTVDKKSTTSTNVVGWVAQILGPGAPTWPLLQYAVYGTKPQ